MLSLLFNLIAEMDLSKLKQNQIDGLHKILEGYDIYLDGNLINCSCASHRIYEYLMSKSRSERPNLDETEISDFSFYRCQEPLEWRGPILSEYGYDKICVPSLSKKHVSVITAGHLCLLVVSLETVPKPMSMR